MINSEKNGILVFQDKHGKFNKTQHALSNLTHNYDIKVGSQDKNGKPVSLTLEVSKAGSLDRDTFERKPDAPCICTKENYESAHPNTLFLTAKSMGRVLESYIDEGKKKTFMAKDGINMREISEEQYHDVDYVI